MGLYFSILFCFIHYGVYYHPNLTLYPLRVDSYQIVDPLFAVDQLLAYQQAVGEGGHVPDHLLGSALHPAMASITLLSRALVSYVETMVLECAVERQRDIDAETHADGDPGPREHVASVVANVHRCLEVKGGVAGETYGSNSFGCRLLAVSCAAPLRRIERALAACATLVSSQWRGAT